MPQQTAVEWLVKEFSLENFTATIEFAKQKEKEQIIEAGNACGLKAILYRQGLSKMSVDELRNKIVEDDLTFGEEYYNKTFKSE